MVWKLLLLLMICTSCSGPMLMSIQEEKEKGAISKLSSSNKESQFAVPDDEGVFDDSRNQLRTNLSLWKLIDDRSGIRTYEKRSSHSDLVSFRGEVLIPASLKKIASVLINDAYQKDWIDSFVETRRIVEKDEFEHVKYNQTSVPWPFQNRDFVFRVFARLNSNPATMLVTMNSVEDPRAPPVSGVVRGKIVHSYYYLKEISGLRATKMVVEMEVDPMGAIPHWMVNLSQKNWPHNTLAALKRLCMREDIRILPKLDEYFDKNKLNRPKKGIKKI